MNLETKVGTLWERIKRYSLVFAAAIPLSFASPSRSLADDRQYKPTYAETNISSYLNTNSRTAFNNYISNAGSGWTRMNNVCIIGWGHGIADAKSLMSQNYANSFGKRFDHVFSSNFTGNKLTNSLNTVPNNLGVSLVGPKDQSPYEKIWAKELWLHSQGNDTFVNWANMGVLKADTINIVSPPFASGSGYLSKLETAIEKAGVKQVNIYQNLGEKSSILDNDHLTTLPMPSLQLVPSNSSVPSLGMKMRFDSFPELFGLSRSSLADKNINWYKNYTSPGRDRIYEESGIRIHEMYNMPQMGHTRDNYFPNIREIEMRTQYLPKDYIGPTTNLNVFGRERIVPVAPLDYWKSRSAGIDTLGILNSKSINLQQAPKINIPSYSQPILPSINIPRQPLIYTPPTRFDIGNRGNFSGGYMNPRTYQPPVMPQPYNYTPPIVPSITNRRK